MSATGKQTCAVPTSFVRATWAPPRPPTYSISSTYVFAPATSAMRIAAPGTATAVSTISPSASVRKICSSPNMEQ